MKYLSLGSYSSGTMRSEDLIPTFLDALESVDPVRAREIRLENLSLLNALDAKGEAWDALAEEASMFVDDLFDVLNEYCAPYTYFSASEGDGADYGCWAEVDALKEDMTYGDVLDFDKVDTHDLIDGTLVAHISDHGNIELFQSNGPNKPLTSLWSLV